MKQHGLEYISLTWKRHHRMFSLRFCCTWPQSLKIDCRRYSDFRVFIWKDGRCSKSTRERQEEICSPLEEKLRARDWSQRGRPAKEGRAERNDLSLGLRCMAMAHPCMFCGFSNSSSSVLLINEDMFGF
mmetsp:Transcript_64754/g.124921  ORF Transcript_64754/g.124921 Transcript_64754/m.124921 type:complete len:129 (+) Transcript_64754:53-439(+)